MRHAPEEVERRRKRQARDEADRAKARDAELRTRWEALPDAEREAILAQVKAENPGLSRWKKMLEPLCLVELERRHGRPLTELDRKTKQSVIRILETRGAFSVRHGVETVATALGVSRFTVYNYLNRENAAKGER